MERFFLDRVDTKPRRPAVGRENHVIALSHAHKTGATLAFMQFAVARAQVALNAAIIIHVPVKGGVGFGLHQAYPVSQVMAAGATSFHLVTV
jgi:hypothetical protein